MKVVIFAKTYKEADEARKSRKLYNAVIVTDKKKLAGFGKDWEVINLTRKEREKEK
jgi:hypothetical protein